MAQKAHRDYGNTCPSVTQVLGVLRKIGLEFWFKNNTAQFCNEKSKRGREIGMQIHEAIQSHIEKEEVKIKTQYAEEVSNALKSFMLFRKEHPEIKLKKSEMMLTSEKHGYNGTMDVEGQISRVIVLGDWKTGECKDKYDKPPIYDEFIYQVAAYLKAYNEVTGQKTKEAFIAVFAKDAIAYNYRLISEEEINSSFEEVFLSCLKIYNFQKGVTNGYSSRQRSNGDSKGIRKHSQPSTKLPSSF